MKDSLRFLYGAAYYDEYMPYDRIDTDFALMRDAGMNTVRIAESTWSTYEKSDGVFDFTTLHRMLDAATKYDISVIVGTPTYAIPAWLAKKHPDIMSETADGKLKYGRRQQFDLTNPNFRKYAERIIRRLMEEVADHPKVIGYQLDNETRSAGAASIETQKIFTEGLKNKFPDIDEFNREFGLDYWSNRIDDWDDMPDVTGTINGSLSAEYKAFLRQTITDFLHWQADIVRQYMRKDQFITHNFDFSWISYSHGIQPEVNQADCAECMDIAGTDIYHLSQSKLDGAMIAFGGSVGRSLKKSPYLVLETQAQGRISWLPYPGQLRLQAYSHIANGARSVMYWNWHSIHNAIESYWKGVLSHDLTPGVIYEEAKNFRHEMMDYEDHLLITEKNSDVAILVDNRSLTGINEFPFMEDDDAGQYNDVLRTIYDTLYKMNKEVDIVYTGDDYSSYKVLVVPMLYSASEDTIEKLRKYVENGGHLVLTFRSLFSDEHIKIYHDAQPHGFTDVTGMTYDNFTIPDDVSIIFTDNPEENRYITHKARNWMELIRPATADIWATYDHPAYRDYAAITHKRYGTGRTTYIGTNLDEAGYTDVFEKIFSKSDIDVSLIRFPFIIRSGTNKLGKTVTYYLNYSSEEVYVTYTEDKAELIISDDYTDHVAPTPDDKKYIASGDGIRIEPWSLAVIETQ